MIKLRWIGLALIIIAVVVYGGKKWLGKEDAPPAIETTNNLTVTVISPAVKTINDVVSVTGMTVAREEIIVASELPNVRIQLVFADVGSVVKTGQRLATLDGESFRYQLTQMQSDYDRAHDEFSRIDAIKNTGAVSQESVTQKRTAMESAQAKLEDARLNVRHSTIVAPSAGVIIERKAAIGALVSANEPLYRIAHNNEIELEAHVPEAELAALKIGQKVVFTVTGRADEMEGKVRLITPRIDPANRTAMIRVALAANTSLPVGLFADATIIAGEVSGMVIPATALQQDTIGSFVWHVTAENKAARLPVRVIFRSNEDIVVNDIPNDARIVARAGAFVKEGDSLNVTGGNE